MKDFTQHYRIIYDKYLLLATKDSSLQSSRMGLARFLGVNHGKMQAWGERGQWPSAADLTTIETKLGFNLRWLVTGEDSPEGQEEKRTEIVQPTDAAGTLAENTFLKQQIAELQSVNIQLVTSLKDTVHELKQAQTESIGWQKEFLTLQGKILGKEDMPSVTVSPVRGAPTQNHPNEHVRKE